MISLAALCETCSALAVNRNAMAPGWLLARAIRAVSGNPNCPFHRSINQRGCDVSIESLSRASPTSAVGSYLVSRVARRKIALTKPVADFTRAALTRLTDSLIAAEAGTRD